MQINIKDNKDRMQKSIATSQPINVYLKQIEDPVQFAADGNTLYTTNQILQMVCLVTLTTGLYPEKIKAWHHKVAGDQK